MKVHGKLTRTDIEKAVSYAEDFAKKWGAAQTDCLKVRLMTEEVLLIYQDSFDEDSKFVFRMCKNPAKLCYTITIGGTSLDPTTEKNPFTEILGLFKKDNNNFTWQYEQNRNQISFTIPIHTTSILL
ncbi:MAG: hypothetical protein K6E70_00320 [Butyrivibrio sp.]|nr:hypothetical protein [Butyrivibrio sp.]